MIIDFGSRLSTAFGFVAVNVAAKLLEQGFGEVIQDNGNYDLAVYNMDESTQFDEVLIRRDNEGKKEEFLFAYRSINDDYASVFATPPMLSIDRDKNLVETPIDNTDIVVVERYGTKPAEITWKGLLIDLENHRFPIDKMEQINKIFEVNGVWNVDSEILNRLGVKAMYIKRLQIRFVEGFEDTIAYTMVTSAIKDLEYQLTN